MSAASPAQRSRISGTGHYLPTTVRTNAELSQTIDTSDQWIRERTGIRERRIAPPEIATSDMATAAGAQALAAAGLSAGELDMIIVATVTPDMPMPATAVLVQQKLAARPDCPAFDISAACAGFVFGLSIADKFIATGTVKHVLVIGVELLSRVVNWQDRTTCVLFGDGAGAVVVSRAEGPHQGEILTTQLHTDGSLAHSLTIPGGGTVEPLTHASLDAGRDKVHMRGQDIFRAAVKHLCGTSQAALDAGGVSAEQLDWLCAHQANLRIIEQVVVRTGIARDKVLTNIERVGNTSSASIPILLDEHVRNGTIKPGQTVLMCALGAGISWGSALVRM
jgi:3-oxoacyl-[acyl-carrier-protein] synthase-3